MEFSVVRGYDCAAYEGGEIVSVFELHECVEQGGRALDFKAAIDVQEFLVEGIRFKWAFIATEDGEIVLVVLLARRGIEVFAAEPIQSDFREDRLDETSENVLDFAVVTRFADQFEAHLLPV